MSGWPVLALAWAGPVAVAAAWVAVRVRGVRIWTAMGVTLAPLGALSLATGELNASSEVGVGAAVGAGLAAGVTLYLATAGFMFSFRRWGPLARQAADLYGRVRGLPVPAVLAVVVLVVATGEELLWRGVVQGALAERTGDLSGAGLTWGAYVAANAASCSLPILLATLVAGASWGALALWTQGVLASILCHVAWTGLMILRPPIFGAYDLDR